MNISQISYLAALVTAGLSKKKISDVDLSKADWSLLKPYLVDNDLLSIVGEAFKVFPEYIEASAPHSKALLQQAVRYNLETLSCSTELDKLAGEWSKEGKGLLAVGGMVLAKNYPAPHSRGGRTIVCTPLVTNKENVAAERFSFEEFDRGSLHVCVLSTLVPQDTDADAAIVAQVLEDAFFSAPCRRYGVSGLMPNSLFTALYLLNGAHHQFIDGVMNIRVLLDWAMVLRAIGEREPDFDWGVLAEKCEALGITHFVHVLTAAAVRLTGVELVAGAASLGVASADDADLLLGYVLDPAKSAPTSRLGKFASVFLNSKKYSRVMGVSPVSAAFRALFK